MHMCPAWGSPSSPAWERQQLAHGTGAPMKWSFDAGFGTCEGLKVYVQTCSRRNSESVTLSSERGGPQPALNLRRPSCAAALSTLQGLKRPLTPRNTATLPQHTPAADAAKQTMRRHTPAHAGSRLHPLRLGVTPLVGPAAFPALEAARARLVPLLIVLLAAACVGMEHCSEMQVQCARACRASSATHVSATVFAHKMGAFLLMLYQTFVPNYFLAVQDCKACYFQWQCPTPALPFAH